MSLFRKIIYTNVIGLELSDDILILDYKELPDSFVNWVEKKTMENLQKRNKYEERFSEILKEQSHLVVEQPFFKIDDDCYFLDFFIPDMRLAIEIDGSAHKKQRTYDEFRDMQFKSIGITTIRISNVEVNLPNIKELINNYIRKVLSRNPKEVEKYFALPIANRCCDKLTDEQKSLLYVIDEFSKISVGSKILIKTDFKYLTYVLNHYNREKIVRSKNSILLARFYDLVENKNIRYDVIFCSKKKNSNKAASEKSALNANKHNLVVTINGCDLSKYNNKKYSDYNLDL